MGITIADNANRLSSVMLASQVLLSENTRLRKRIDRAMRRVVLSLTATTQNMRNVHAKSALAILRGIGEE